MIIRTPDEWWKAAMNLARSASFRDYLLDYRIRFDFKIFERNYEDNALSLAWRQFQTVWEQLPDSPQIRRGPFAPLSDVCSEGMAFLHPQKRVEERAKQEVFVASRVKKEN